MQYGVIEKKSSYYNRNLFCCHILKVLNEKKKQIYIIVKYHVSYLNKKLY